MAPYSKKVKARYEGSKFVLSEPLELPFGREVNLTVEASGSEPKATRAKSLKELLDELAAEGKLIQFGQLTDDAFKRDEKMYPDRW